MEKPEYFFDGDANIFKEVLKFYTRNSLHIPKDVCQTDFEEQIAFWDIDKSAISDCCVDSDEASLAEQFGWFERRIEPESYWTASIYRRFQAWCFLVDPTGPYTKCKRASIAWAILYLMLTILKSLVMGVMTLPAARGYEITTPIPAWFEAFERFNQDTTTGLNAWSTIPFSLGSTEFMTTTESIAPTTVDTTITATVASTTTSKNATFNATFNTTFNTSICDEFVEEYEFVGLLILSRIEYGLSFFFILEIIIRLTVCPDKRFFFKTVMHVLDLIVSAIEFVGIIFIFIIYEVFVKIEIPDNSNPDSMLCEAALTVSLVSTIVGQLRCLRFLSYASMYR